MKYVKTFESAKQEKEVSSLKNSLKKNYKTISNNNWYNSWIIFNL